ncbi:hypothetical protein [Riemerella anatipestifer]|uniref:Septum formation initiator n=1 Tax=Riemerella anatipestifer RA-CH-1 TaxID=1228997 RepID=J9R6C2_RIEAN|nr:hypothetical protein [Riemerella anatipestifer]AFR36043.1 hypothetical protein B739_1445 [Riemerella anatipestifer RA-CH-1]AIH03036.1 hypothetical protein M949_1869 [Riemerella anatipestifer CH3]MCO7332933.1 hypothetical protein [Riemerella anatipestifer]MCO7351833.1 hypothetical protein [Riemerella anatipestifer]MCU7583110.1 hypothetical protein [Riemerella anatipestifer]
METIKDTPKNNKLTILLGIIILLLSICLFQVNRENNRLKRQVSVLNGDVKNLNQENDELEEKYYELEQESENRYYDY